MVARSGTWLTSAGALLSKLRGLCDGLWTLQAASSILVLGGSSTEESTEARRSAGGVTSLSIAGAVACAHSATVCKSSCHTSGDMRSPALTASRTKAATPTEAKL